MGVREHQYRPEQLKKLGVAPMCKCGVWMLPVNKYKGFRGAYRCAHCGREKRFDA